MASVHSSFVIFQRPISKLPKPSIVVVKEYFRSSFEFLERITFAKEFWFLVMVFVFISISLLSSMTTVYSTYVEKSRGIYSKAHLFSFHL